MKTPLMAFMAEQSRDMERGKRFKFDFAASPSTIAEYVTQIMCWHRVCLLEDVGDGFSGVDYWTNNVLLWDVLDEDWGAEETLGWDGCAQRMYDIFSLPLDSVDGEEKQTAEALVWRLLSSSSMQKVARGKGLMRNALLGELWDQDREDRDAKVGTYAELFRYGSENFVQTRKEIRYVEAPRPHKTLKKGLLEA